MSEKLVLLDGHSLMYRAYHGLSTPMNAPDGTPTNAVHGFMLMLTKIIADEKPTMLAAAFDMHHKTLRAERYAAYKGTRKPMPDDLRAQEPIIRELLGLMGIPMLELPGYEADDILGTVSAACEQMQREVVIVTGDRDSYQLAGEYTTILYTKKGISDTVRVTPAYLMETYGMRPTQMIDVKGLMGDASDNIPGIEGIGEKTALKLLTAYGTLENVLENASKEKGKLRERLENGSEIARLSKSLATIDRAVPIEYRFEDFALHIGTRVEARLGELGLNVAKKRVSELNVAEPEEPAAPREIAVEILPDLKALVALGKKKAKAVCAFAEQEFFHLSVDEENYRLELCQADLLGDSLDANDCYAAVKPLLYGAKVAVVYNIKELPVESRDFAAMPLDAMLLAYVCDPGRGSFAAGAICNADDFSACPSRALLEAAQRMEKTLRDCDMMNVYAGIELPLAFVLRGMEREGVRVDAKVLNDMGVVLRENIERTAARIEREMGKRINLNSPKQLGQMLFEEMGLPAPKKTQRGYSTAASVLEELAPRYPVCEWILEYRKNQKLESTYIQTLLKMRDEESRIHTQYDQVGTSTGRISSLEPNLQNIPVRTELGRGIRKAFVAKEGCTLVDADYSQIELRVLAHISEDATMIDSFNRGQDIHTRTASEVYGVPIEDVTPAMRTATKAVNFGIIYGISDFTLARNIGVSRAEAKEFIERYFARYPGVKRYMDEIIVKGRADGYVSTLMGRRRYLPDLSASNFNIRSFAERCAMNSPIQGTAADVIKLAMIAVRDRLQREGLRARLILQVHDELILETPLEEEEAVKALLREEMENVVQLKVPLCADVHAGGDWSACK